MYFSGEAHEFGPAFHSQFRLRYGGFIERQGYDVDVYDGMEFDKYDTPASRYLVYHTDEGQALGVSRLTPTTLSCMLRDLWPKLVEDQSLLRSAAIWEGTRYCIDKDVEPDLRQRIIHEMACAYLEFGLRLGLNKDHRADADLYLSQRLRVPRHCHGVSEGRAGDRPPQVPRGGDPGNGAAARQCAPKDRNRRHMLRFRQHEEDIVKAKAA